MTCVCGYDDQDLEVNKEFGNFIKVDSAYFLVPGEGINYLYICPKCRTVKMEEKK